MHSLIVIHGPVLLSWGAGHDLHLAMDWGGGVLHMGLWWLSVIHSHGSTEDNLVHFVLDEDQRPLVPYLAKFPPHVVDIHRNVIFDGLFTPGSLLKGLCHC